MIPLRQWLSRPAPTAEAITAETGQNLYFAEGVLPAALVAEDLIADAYERGRAESNALTQKLVQAAVDTERLLQADVLATARGQWATLEADLLKKELEDAHHHLLRQISDTLAAVLAGFLEETAATAAVTSFRVKLMKLAEDHPLIRVEAAEDLAAELVARGLPPGVEVRPSTETSLRAVAGDTVIETNLAAWLACVRGKEQ